MYEQAVVGDGFLHGVEGAWAFPALVSDGADSVFIVALDLAEGFGAGHVVACKVL